MKGPNQRLMDWDNLRISFLFGYRGLVPGTGRGTRVNPSATAWLIDKGWAQVTDETGQRFFAKQGQWLMVRPGIRKQEFSPDAEILSLNFRANLTNGENLFRSGLSLILDAADNPSLEKSGIGLLKTVKKAIGSNPAGFGQTAQSSLSMEGYLIIQTALLNWIRCWSDVLLVHGISPSICTVNDPRVSLAMDFIQSHMLDGELDGERVAAEVGLGLSQLNRLFIRERGETLRAFRQRQRIEHAHHLLMRTACSVKEVAAKLGFHQQSHFTTWFRKETGFSPSQFRKNPSGNRFFPKQKARS